MDDKMEFIQCTTCAEILDLQSHIKSRKNRIISQLELPFCVEALPQGFNEICICHQKQGLKGNELKKRQRNPLCIYPLEEEKWAPCHARVKMQL